ncbi:MAG: aldo/keto reductase [Phycisphaerae bacterium]
MNTPLHGKLSFLNMRLAYGCMRTVGTWNPQEVTAERVAISKTAIAAAVDAGYTLFDHADIYCSGACERVFGEFLHETPALRQQMIIATKCGIRFPGVPNPDSPHRYDFSAEHIMWSCEQSLKRLQIETIGLYHLHRPDLLMNPVEVAEAFEKLRTQGKVRYFGVSNFAPSFLTALQRHCPMPLVVNQVPIHLGDLHCFYDGTLDQCLAEGIIPLAYSPVGGGFLGTGGQVSEKHPRREMMLKLVALLDQTAAKYGVSRTVIALAWLLKHPAKIIPIVGSAKPAHIAEAAKAVNLDLSREDWYRLLVAARGEGLP